jgi:hypothetical protein
MIPGIADEIRIGRLTVEFISSVHEADFIIHRLHSQFFLHIQNITIVKNLVAACFRVLPLKNLNTELRRNFIRIPDFWVKNQNCIGAYLRNQTAPWPVWHPSAQLRFLLIEAVRDNVMRWGFPSLPKTNVPIIPLVESRLFLITVTIRRSQ